MPYALPIICILSSYYNSPIQPNICSCQSPTPYIDSQRCRKHHRANSQTQSNHELQQFSQMALLPQPTNSRRLRATVCLLFAFLNIYTSILHCVLSHLAAKCKCGSIIIPFLASPSASAQIPFAGGEPHSRRSSYACQAQAPQTPWPMKTLLNMTLRKM